jgi:hypothetical protein
MGCAFGSTAPQRAEQWDWDILGSQIGWPPFSDESPALSFLYGVRDAVKRDQRSRRKDGRDRNTITALGTET